MKTFSEFVEALELGTTEEVFTIDENVEYEDWGEPEEEGFIYEAKKMKGKDPCWSGYQMVGMKKGKGGKPVPNCVPIKESDDQLWILHAKIGMAGRHHGVYASSPEEAKKIFNKSRNGMVVNIKKASESDYRDAEKINKPKSVKEEAEHGGRKVKLNRPFLTPNGPKKRSVYVKNEKGNVVKVNFGDPNMTIKKNNPARRKSFRARHGCDVDAGPRWKAKYWSCKAW